MTQTTLTLARLAEDTLRALVEGEGHTSLAAELESVRRFRVRMDARASVQERVQSEQSYSSTEGIELAMHNGRRVHVLRRFRGEIPREKVLQGGFVMKGDETMDLAEVLYCADWYKAIIPAIELRSVA